MHWWTGWLVVFLGRNIFVVHALSSSAMTLQRLFPFVHPTIAAVLQCDANSLQDNNRNHHHWNVDPVTLCISNLEESCGDDDPISNSSLVQLAHACDEVVFSDKFNIPFPNGSDLQGLVKMASVNQHNPSHVMVATLLVTNGLESAIRHHTEHATGRAPLLKQMLTQVSNNKNRSILQSLLLPTPCLNLRNLLWHGCVSELPRPWLALVLVLTYSLLNQETEQNDIEKPTPTLVQLRNHERMVPILNRGEILITRSIHDFSLLVKNWLSPSHHDLWDLTVDWIENRRQPACILAVMSILLEHGLRQDWCRVNHRPEDAMARPGAYFVTLDGHGQRHQHNLLLHPFVTDEEHVPNALVDQLGGPTIALLVDLFCSSCGGPNIRAALSHGMLDAYLEDEIVNSMCEEGASGSIPKKQDDLWDMVRAVCTAMEGAASKSPSPLLSRYKPIFSFRATTVRNIQEALLLLERLIEFQSSEEWIQTEENDYLSDLNVSLGCLKHRFGRILPSSNDSWDAQSVFYEHDVNVRLAPCTAARTLLGDVADATRAHVQILEDALAVNKDMTPTSRQSRRWKRLCDVTEPATTMYSFFTHVALLSLEQHLEKDGLNDNGALPPCVVLKAVERSRMCVSTISTFLVTNSDRAVKAAKEYAKGKAVKTIVQQKERDAATFQTEADAKATNG